MTIQAIIEEAKELTNEQKLQLGYYFLFSTLKEEKRNDLIQLFLNSFNFSGIETGNKKQQKNTKPVFGMMKGGIKYMAPDFDEPLEDFSDYM